MSENDNQQNQTIPKEQLLMLSCFNKIGPRGLKKLSQLDQLDLNKISAKNMMAVGISENIAREFVEFREKFDVDYQLDRLKDLGIRTITKDDAEYPPLLQEITDPPYLLYILGKLPDFTDKTVLAVVGSRRSTHYGKQIVEQIVPILAQAGMVIISGLALGIDAMAHEAALGSGQITVAVIGSGLDVIYPSQNLALAQKIVQNNGAVISEYPLGTPPLKQHFPARNRIISGMSHGTMVVECDIKSGAMITAHHALDQNREVFAVPGPITAPLSAGPNSLLRLGAAAVASPKDVLDSFNLAWCVDSPVIDDGPLPPGEQAVLSLLSHEPTHIDTLVTQSKLEMADVNSALLFLEIKGKVRNVGAAFYIRR